MYPNGVPPPHRQRYQIPPGFIPYQQANRPYLVTTANGYPPQNFQQNVHTLPPRYHPNQQQLLPPRPRVIKPVEPQSSTQNGYPQTNPQQYINASPSCPSHQPMIMKPAEPPSQNVYPPNPQQNGYPQTNPQQYINNISPSFPQTRPMVMKPVEPPPSSSQNCYPQLEQNVHPLPPRYHQNQQQLPPRPVAIKPVESASSTQNSYPQNPQQNGYPQTNPQQNINHVPACPPNQQQQAPPLSRPMAAVHVKDGDKISKDPSIVATSNYLSIYATTVDSVLRKTISNMSSAYNLESRPISIGKPHYNQQNVYKFVEAVIAEINKKQNEAKRKVSLRYAYITKTEAECFMELSYIDAKNQVGKSVIYFRYGELEYVTLFGSLEAGKAWKAFEARNEYKSEALFFRKATEYLNEVLLSFKFRSSDSEKLFKCVIAFLAQLLKTQQMPCRVCQLYIKNEQVPTVFSGMALGNVSVAHPCCAAREGFI